MNKKSLEAIQEAVRHARDIVCILACENYPRTPFEDSDLVKMFYELNTMSITLSKKIDGLEVVACPTTDTIPASSSASAPEN